MILETPLIVDLLLALSIGAIMGLEREIMHQKNEVQDFGGIRTFILIALLGFIVAYVEVTFASSPAIFLVGFLTFMLLMVASYILIGSKTGRVSLTTEIAAIITFLLAALLAWDTEQKLNLITVILAVIVTSLLAVKRYLHTFAKKIQMQELYAALKLAIITLVILPLLPNKNYTPLEIPGISTLLHAIPSTIPIASQLAVFNPFKIWLMVAFISSISFIGYILIKTLGSNKGIGITSFLGGLVSSTSVTIALAGKSRESAWNMPLAIGIVIASTVMFGRVLLEVLVVNPSLAIPLALPIGAMILTGLIVTIVLARKPHSGKEETVEFKSPFALGPALKFGILFGVILALARILHILFGNAGVYSASILAGLADVDAITITLATLARTASLEPDVAIIGITFAIAANMAVKGIIAYVTGARSLAKIVCISFLSMICAGALTAYFM